MDPPSTKSWSIHTRKEITNKYEIFNRIGAGAYSDVYKARRRSDSVTVALKEVHDYQSAFREIEALQTLQHCPNVVVLHEYFWREDEDAVLVLEYLPTDLGCVIREAKKWENGLSLGEIKRWMVQILCGVDACHRNSIVHRDLKPSNLLISDDGMLKLADFGQTFQHYPNIFVLHEYFSREDEDAMLMLEYLPTDLGCVIREAKKWENGLSLGEDAVLMLEYLPTDLGCVIREAKKWENGLSLGEIKKWMVQILCGVDACHRNSIVHRDLKPSNLLISDDGVLKLADFGQYFSREDEDAVLVLEYLPTDLGCVIIEAKKWENGLGLGEIKRWMVQILCGVDACHRNSIVHRDLKPSNLLISDDGVLKLADFGQYLPTDLGCVIRDAKKWENGLSLGEIKRWMVQILCGVDACHKNSIVHRDLKPSNLLISNDGVLKLADIG
ncbi:Cyclin-dependent kinase F-1 [Capsicum annuum]|nr:Cyclin-dependent kinase F-1 [Capsicum annuum]